MKLSKAPIIICAALCLVSCKTSGEKRDIPQEPEQVTLEEIIAGAEAISPQIGNFNDVFNMLNLVEAPYYPVLCNEAQLAGKYAGTATVAAANLGIYVSDMIYHLYGRATETVAQMLNSSQELADSLGLGEAFGEAFRENLDGGIISRDSLIVKFNQLLASSKKFHTEEERLHLHTAFLGGLLIEKLYITSSLLNEITHSPGKSTAAIINGRELLVIFKNQLVSADALIDSILKQKAELSGLFLMQELGKIASRTGELKDSLHGMLTDEKLGPNEILDSLHHSIRALREQVISAG